MVDVRNTLPADFSQTRDPVAGPVSSHEIAPAPREMSGYTPPKTTTFKARDVIQGSSDEFMTDNFETGS